MTADYALVVADRPLASIAAAREHATTAALAQAGALERARTVFTTAIEFVNDVGLLAEEVDPATGELLGNFPQAFSHIGLVNAAWAISQAEAQTTDH